MTCPQCKDPWTYRCGGCGTVKTTISWIPVSERLPEDDQLVVISALMPIGSLVGYRDKGVWRLVSGHRLAIASVTHWTELPEPPTDRPPRSPRSEP